MAGLRIPLCTLSQEWWFIGLDIISLIDVYERLIFSAIQ